MNIIHYNKIFPIICFFKDRTIDLKGASKLIVPMIYIGNKRKLTLLNIPKEANFIIEVKGNFTNHGTVQIVRIGDNISDLVPAPIVFKNNETN